MFGVWSTYAACLQGIKPASCQHLLHADDDEGNFEQSGHAWPFSEMATTTTTMITTITMTLDKPLQVETRLPDRCSDGLADRFQSTRVGFVYEMRVKLKDCISPAFVTQLELEPRY